MLYTLSKIHLTPKLIKKNIKMRSFSSIIRLDYLQRTRSYSFLVTVCISLAIGYSFMPPPDAAYTTISIGGYQGIYNSAWFGYATALLSSIFLSLIGFYLVNSGVKKDIITKVGQIAAATPIHNIQYLMTKVLSNFMVLFTLAIIMFTMSIVLFFLYNEGYSFELINFIKPYLIVTLPALFFIAVLAVIFEVVLEKYTVLQNTIFFIVFIALFSFTTVNDTRHELDVFGSKMITSQMETAVNNISTEKLKEKVQVGYIINHQKTYKKFDFNGIDFSISFIGSRLLWILFGIGSIALVSPFFHRFKNNNAVKIKKSKEPLDTIDFTAETTNSTTIVIKTLAKIDTNYGILPLLKTELILLLRTGKKWLWLISIIGMFLLSILPLEIAHSIVLPILWFLQVGRLSELATKEITHNVHYFTNTAYKPLSRLLSSQLLAGLLLMLLLASPLIIRFVVLANFTSAIAVFFGSIFTVLFAVLLGIVSKGKKLFEVLFFMITYANINNIKALTYYDAINTYQLSLLLYIIVAMLSIIYSIRIKQLKS